MKIRIELNEGQDIYVCSKLTGFIFRTALRLKERQEEERMTTYLLDDIAQFVCDVFGNRFTVSDLYRGIEKGEMLKVFNNVVRLVIATTSIYEKNYHP